MQKTQRDIAFIFMRISWIKTQIFAQIISS